jgi:hypothetical protein
MGIKEVAPHTGAWIEILTPLHTQLRLRSLPTRERGLKSLWGGRQMGIKEVAPHTGAWIRIQRFGLFSSLCIEQPT